MRKNRTWAVAAFAALALLLAAISAYADQHAANASPAPRKAAASSGDQAAPQIDESGEPVVLTLHLTGESETSGAPELETVLDDQRPDYDDLSVASAIQRTTDRIRSLALRFVGTPYRWGGTTPAAFDCSGFTRYVYRKLGVLLPRTARQQFKVGTAVKSGHWKTGDLLFFDMRKGYVSHVGMYLSDMRFIHASNPRTGVRIDCLNKGSYKRCYVGARRYQTT